MSSGNTEEIAKRDSTQSHLDYEDTANHEKLTVFLSNLSEDLRDHVV